MGGQAAPGPPEVQQQQQNQVRFFLFIFFLFAESRVLSLFAYFPLDICNLPLHTHVHLNRQFCDSLTGAKEIVDPA